MVDVEAMQESERFLRHVAPRAAEDLQMALTYEHAHSEQLMVPITSYEGLLNDLAEPGVMTLWGDHTGRGARNVPILGAHDFPITHRREVR